MVGIDRFSTLPPELILPIFEHNRDQSGREKTISLIAKPFLHAQRSELYRIVRLYDLDQFIRFSETIRSVNALGPMVKELHMVFWTGETDDGSWMPKWAEDGEQITRSMFPHLTSLRMLRVTSPVMSRIFLDLATQNVLTLTTLITLDLRLNNDCDALAQSILAVFPQLHFLDLDFDPDLPLSPTNLTTASILPLDPPKLLDALTLRGNLLASSLSNIVSSTEARCVLLDGVDVDTAVKLLRNSEHMKELALHPTFPTMILDRHLLQLNHIAHLTLNDFVNLGPTFFTDYFPSCSLQSLNLLPRFELKAADLIQACQKKPASLKTLVIDVLGDSESMDECRWKELMWTRDCTVSLMRQLISVYRLAGVKVQGSVNKAVRVGSEWAEYQ
jgi:hypothetical protein